MFLQPLKLLARRLVTSLTLSTTTMTTRYVPIGWSERWKGGTDGHVNKIDWQQDTLTWLIDGQQVRQLKRSDVTGSDGISRYPSTPSRIELRCVSLFFPFILLHTHAYSLRPHS